MTDKPDEQAELIAQLRARIEMLEQRAEIAARRLNNMADRLTALETRRHDDHD